MRTLSLLALSALIGCNGSAIEPAPHVELSAPKTDVEKPDGKQPSQRQLVVAGGCFWCTEAVFEELKGVKSVIVGYAGGKETDADYKTVSRGRTNHAEVIKITYDARVISFGRLLQVFFSIAHDPTQKNRQGPDVGRQYRSAIFYADDEQKRVAAAYIKQLNAEKSFPKPIATILEPLEEFYPAEDYHQDYVQRNPNHRYVRKYSLPKVLKLRQVFPDLVREK